MGGTLDNGIYLPDQGERNCYNGLKNNWDTLDNLIETVQALSSAGLTRELVTALPTDNIKTNVIYMLRNSQQSGDLYDEYMYINNAWEPIGTSATEMDNYYTKSETNALPAVASGITASKVTGYDSHVANTEVHITAAERSTWSGKQNALDTDQTAAVNSGVNATKVTGYDTHVADTVIHVTSSDKTAWNAKQDGLSQTQLNAVNSGVTDTKVTGYDTHVADTSAHVSSSDRTAWNGKQDALSQTQLNNIAAVPDKANSADLATVATTGDYGDLLNAPTIPTVNNATLTIQKNGTDVATFTANASSNVTANLSIPTDTSDLTNGAGFLTQHNPIDNELSVSSENAVQNKVVTTALNSKAASSHTHAAGDINTGTFNIARIPDLDASKITSGTIDIARLPKGSLERLVKVADQAARFALTTDDVQLGDTVQQLDTGVMYVVTDETKLDSADGYTEFTAGSATSVPWSGVTGKPSTFTPSSHTHGNVTNDGKVGTTANLPLITGTGGVVQAGSFGNSANTFCEGNDSRLSDARTPVAHTHGKADITDLFNSANTWSALNSYSNGRIRIKSQSQEIGVIPSNSTIQYLEFADKNDAQYGMVGLWNYSGGASEIQMYIVDKFKNGAKDPTGTSESTFLSFGFKTDGSKFLTFSGQVDNSIIPLSNNLYSLGSSTNQWWTISSRYYYYNGVAWGLDKANVWTTTQTIKENSPALTLKSNVISKGTIPSSRANAQIFFRDNSDYETARVLYRADTDGTRMLWIGVNDVYSNGALDPAGSSIWNNLILSISPTGQKAISVNSDIIPDNSTHNLGTSTNQWNSVYAQSYYYNGTAWGLDKANVWTGDNTFTSPQITLKHSGVTRGVIPNSNKTYVLRFTDSNNDTVGMLFQQIRTNTGSYKMTFSLDNGTTDHRFNFYGYTDGTSSLIPEVSGVTNLGSPSYKWKTLNGINPGALSLPDISGADPIDFSQWDVSGAAWTNYYTPSANGWLRITITDRATNSIYVFNSNDISASIYGNGSQTSGGTNRLVLLMPVLSGVQYCIIIVANSISDVGKAEFIPCKGNV